MHIRCPYKKVAFIDVRSHFFILYLYCYTFIQFSSVAVTDDVAFIFNIVIVPDFRDALFMSCVTVFSFKNLKLSWKTGTEMKKCHHR